MRSFAKIASCLSLIPLALPAAGCLAASGDDLEPIEEAALTDVATPAPASPTCGPGTLIQSLGYPLPGFYGAGFYPGYYGAGFYGGGFGPGFYGGGYGLYNPGYYVPGYGAPGAAGGGTSTCGCPPATP